MENKNTIIVFDKNNTKQQNCSEKRAERLIKRGLAIKINDNSIKLLSSGYERRVLKRKIIQEENRICYICGRRIPLDEKATVDHVIPLKNANKFVEYRFNKRCCCQRCNTSKSLKKLSKYVDYIKRHRDKFNYLPDSRLEKLLKIEKEVNTKMMELLKNEG